MCINYIKITLKSYLIKNVIPCIIVILGILRIYVGSHYRLPAPNYIKTLKFIKSYK